MCSMHAFVTLMALPSCCRVVVGAFHSSAPASFERTTRLNIPFSDRVLTRRYNWLSDLWEEIIEFSTLGPGERKLKKDRENALSAKALNEIASQYYGDGSLEPRNEAAEGSPTDDLSVDAFNTAAALMTAPTVPNEFDGYALRDLLVDKYGAPLDVTFSRTGSGAGGGPSVFCNVMPVALGSRRCRHESELAYLMHLQGVTEILDKYNQLENFVDFLRTTEKTPRVGSFVPYRLQLTEAQLNNIIR